MVSVEDAPFKAKKWIKVLQVPLLLHITECLLSSAFFPSCQLFFHLLLGDADPAVPCTAKPSRDGM